MGDIPASQGSAHCQLLRAQEPQAWGGNRTLRKVGCWDQPKQERAVGGRQGHLQVQPAVVPLR